MTHADLSVYGGYTQAELDAQYNQATLVPDLSPFFARWEAESRTARERFKVVANLPYGAGEDERLDVFPAQQSGTPVHVFLHGGAWAVQGKNRFGYPANLLVPAGACHVVPEFSIAPKVTLDEMVRQVRAAFAWVYRHIAEYGGNPGHIVASGHSSGAHLLAMVLADGWREAAGLPADLIKGAVLISGPYDLEPVRHSARNTYLHLDAAAAHRNTPIHQLGPQTPPLFVGWGDGDLPEFKRQGQHFAALCREKGIAVTQAEFANTNHFEISYAFADPQHLVGQTLQSMLGQG